MAQPQNTDLFRGMTGNLIAGCFALLAATGPALCATAIKIGRTTIPNISHLPIYVDMETGLFGRKGSMPNLSPCRQEPWRPSGWAGNDRFCSTTRFWRQGYPERGRNFFVVGQSLFSPSVLMVPRQITSVAQLRGQSLGFGQRGQASYQDGETILRDRFTLLLGEDNQAFSIPAEKDRFTALEKGHIQAGLFSFTYAAKAEARGFRRLLRTGTFLPRVKGAVWTTASYLKTDRDTIRRFIRAIARASDIIHMDGKTTVAIIQKYFGLYETEETKTLWLSVRDIYTADIPAPLLGNLFADRLRRLRQDRRWPRGKKPPDPEYYMAHRLLSRTLYQMIYALETIDVTTWIH